MFRIWGVAPVSVRETARDEVGPATVTYFEVLGIRVWVLEFRR